MATPGSRRPPPFADLRLPSVPRSGGLLLLAFAGAALLGARLARAGETRWVPFALPVALLLAALWAMRPVPWRERLPMRAVPFRVAAPGLVSLVGSTLVTLATADALTRWFPPSLVQVEAWYGMVGGSTPLLWAVGVAGPVAEEIWFRGVVLRGALARHPPRRAVLLSAILFGAAHLDPYRVLSHSLIGWVFGRWAVATGSLVPSLLGHVALNLAILVPLHGASPDPLRFSGSGWVPGAAALDAAGFAAGGLLVMAGLRWMDRLACAGDAPAGPERAGPEPAGCGPGQFPAR